MFPKTLLKLNYIYLLNHVKMSMAQHRYFFDIKVTVSVQKMLRILLSLGIIRRFYRLTLNKYRIYPGWTFNSAQSRHIKVFSHTKNPLKIKLKSLIILKWNLGNSTLILNTPLGLLTHRQALQLKTGGHLLCVVY